MEKRLTKGDKQRRAELRAQLSLEKADQQNSVNFSGSVSCLAAAGKQSVAPTDMRHSIRHGEYLLHQSLA